MTKEALRWRLFFGFFGGAVAAASILSGCHAAAAGPLLALQPEAARTDSDIVCSSGGGGARGLNRVILRGASDRSACALIRSLAGPSEDARLVERDLEALFATAAFDDVVVVRESDAGRTDLVFELGERPRIGSVGLEGLHSEAAKSALDGFAFETPARLDPTWVKRTEARLKAELVDAGFRSATAASAIGKGAEPAVRFVIDEGPQALLSRVVIDGLRTADEKTLRAELRLAPGAPAAPDVIERDKLVLSVALYDLGLLTSSVDTSATVSPGGDRVEVRFHVTEGPVYRLRGARVAGTTTLDPKQYGSKLAALKRGAVFSRRAVQAVATELEALHREADQPAEVEPKVDFEPGSSEVSVRFEITPP